MWYITLEGDEDNGMRPCPHCGGTGKIPCEPKVWYAAILTYNFGDMAAAIPVGDGSLREAIESMEHRIANKMVPMLEGAITYAKEHKDDLVRLQSKGGGTPASLIHALRGLLEACQEVGPNVRVKVRCE